MSTYSCSKQYSRSNAKQSRYNSNDESAARTRPFSFEDIMRRRKNKGSAANVEGGDTGSHSRRESIDKHITANRESERHFRHSRGSSLDVQNLSLEESAKVSSRRKKEETLLKDNMVVRSDRNNYESGLTLMGKLKYGTNGKDKRQKYGQENLGWGKNDQRSRIDIENETGKSHSRDTAGKDRREDPGKGKFERESKRKFQHGDDDRNKDRHTAKRHDHGKHHDLEITERKEGKISLSSRYGDSRLQRRRKRSLDRESKHKRSSSLSPRPSKHSTKLARQKEPLDSHVKKSGRWRSDSDRTGDFTNSSSSQYRRHSGSTSGLGGYSPRKRRTGSAVKTPSPVRSPEKKNEGLDLLPAEKVGLFSGSVTSNFQPSNPTVSSGISNDQSGGALFSPVMGKSVSGVSSNNLAMKTNASLDLIQLTQATRPMRRLYIENLPHSASEKAIIDCLNGFLTSSGVNHIEGTQPCISCVIHKDRGQALVEFLTPEDASAALSFDGSYFSGSILKIRRPKDYVEIVTGDLDKSVAVVNKISDVVEDSPNKIIIAGISNRISSEMLRDIVTAFGPLKAYHFEINNDLNEPFAFLEYVDQSVMPKACAGLNGMKIGGEVLKVFPAVPFAPLERNGCQPGYGIPEHVKPLLQQPTVVLQVNNVFNADILPVLSDSDIDEVLEDIRFECARFGTVKSMNVAKSCSTCVSAEEEYKNISDVTDVEIKHEIQEISTIVISRNDNDLEDNKANLDNFLDNTYQKQGNCPGNGRHQNKVVEDKLCQMGNNDATCFEGVACESASETIPQGLYDQWSSPGNELHDAKVAKIIETDETGSDKKSVLLGDATTVVADSEKKVLNGLDPMVRTDSDTSEKSEKKDPNNNLESLYALGSVFVEFGRMEASYMAAYSLHGRIYDGQEISVEYIPHDLYRKRFPK